MRRCEHRQEAIPLPEHWSTTESALGAHFASAPSLEETSPVWGRFNSPKKIKDVQHTRNVRIVRYLHRKQDKCINNMNYRNNLYIITTLITIHGKKLLQNPHLATCKNVFFFAPLQLWCSKSGTAGSGQVPMLWYSSRKVSMSDVPHTSFATARPEVTQRPLKCRIPTIPRAQLSALTIEPQSG